MLISSTVFVSKYIIITEERRNSSRKDIMRVLIISDTHRSQKNLKWVLEKEGTIDLLIHLGDSEGCEYEIQEMAGCPVEMVAGNNDFFSDLEREKELRLGKYKVLITHGHYYYVSMGLTELIRESTARGLDIVMFGHTHCPVLHYGNTIILNPGSLSYPRQEGRQPSYAIMETDRKGEAKFEIKYVTED